MNTQFEIIEQRLIPEQQNTKVTLYRHKKTGAQLLSCVNTDQNKVFGVTLRTPPHNSTGVPHILEHSVLCGSKKYPVKEPFVELLKSSLQTFLNAFTYPDKTCYPVASTNVKDFYNLIDVYIDAVFHPRITEDIFKQEGWHLEASSVESPVFFKGVVYNEMKGVYSSADSLFAEKIQHRLFPSTPFSVDSGGEPNTILELTYQEFLDFHTQYYHPSNARFFFWGDDDESVRLEKIASFLEGYTALEVQSSIGLQAPFAEPKYIEHSYESSVEDNATFVACNFLLPETIHAELVFAFEVLEHVLLGMPGSPLRKALIESGLGTDTTGGGLHADLRQMYFSIGLKGVDKKNIHAVEDVIFTTIEKLVEEGIPDKLLEAALTSIEFDLRESNTSRFPVGLAQMVRCLTTWLYDSSPLILMQYEKPLNAIKAKPKEYFTILLRTYFLQNKSRTTVVLLPDTSLASRRLEEEKQRINAIEETLTPESKEALVKETALFIERQALPDTPEALSTIPRLSLQDIDKKEHDIPFIIEGNYSVSPLATSGIAYLDFYFSLSYLPQDMYPLLPLFSRALTEMGTKNRDYVTLGIDISCSLGDIDSSPVFFIECGNREIQKYFVIEVKALQDKLEHAKDLIMDILHSPNFSNKERFLQIVLEEKARVEQSIIPAGHQVVLTRMAFHETQVGQLEEHIAGMKYLAYIRKLEGRVRNHFDEVQQELHALHKAILTKSGIYVNTVCEPEYIEKNKLYFSSIVDTLPSSTEQKVVVDFHTLDSSKEVFITQSQVNYMSKGFNIYQHGIEY
nr:insulinase family protein [Desulfovibrionaceae bacterium]